MAGLLSFLGFGKKNKPNLTPDITAPNAASAPFYGQLKDFASKSISGENGGFGSDFTSRMSNPAIAQIDSNFQNRTLPTISSEASKRGMARSTIVTDQIRQADAQRNRDINSTVADFYKLNELQKKADITQGVGVGQNLNSSYLDQANKQADESQNLRDTTLEVATTNNANDLKRQNQTIGAMMNMVVPGSGTAFSTTNNPSNTPGTVTAPSASANVLSTTPDDALTAELKKRGLIK